MQFLFVDLDECLGITCRNGGTCQDGVNEYTCRCAEGYEGDFCEIGSVLAMVKIPLAVKVALH